MPEKKTITRARADKKAGKSASTQAGEFVRESIHHIREGKHGARSPEQAIAIGLSEARRSGVKVPDKRSKKSQSHTRSGDSASRRSNAPSPDKKGERSTGIRAPKVNPRRSKAATKALRREGSTAASSSALSRHAKRAAATRARTGRRSG